jgi:xanthine dehydrogenase YagT iron-sulfur-binding subunit
LPARPDRIARRAAFAMSTADRPSATPTRRHFLQSAGAIAGTPLIAGQGVAAGAAVDASISPVVAAAAAPAPLSLRINGQVHTLRIEPRVTLLDALRDQLGMTGTKKGCDRGQCGACTVLVNGRRVNSCLTLALAHDGDDVTTIEGLGQPGRLHPMQAAFVEQDAFQCGYCTPGQICSAVALLDEARRGECSAATPDVRRSGPFDTSSLDDAEVRERMSGNLCRCGAYANIVRAVRIVADGGPR